MTRSNGAPAGVVVVYFPDAEVLENIRSYAGSLGFLIIFDNSPAPSGFLEEFSKSSEGIEYRWDGKNHGIAVALNIGAREAISRGHLWLLTMDQDSRFSPGSLRTLIAATETEEAGSTGILSPRHRLPGDAVNDEVGVPIRNVSHVMTSGNLLNLKAWREVGPFLEKLFIDYVDHEYCLRLRRHGYAIKVIRSAELVHSLGKIQPRKLLGARFRPTHHGPLRRYYMTRNRLYVMSRYPASAPGEIWAWAKEIVKLVVFEQDRKLKFRRMAQGARDFVKGRYGPLAV